jgi:hypothetical protein
MLMLSRRVQLLLDEDRYQRLATEAHARGVSVASLIRKAIDGAFPPGAERRAKAIDEILSAPLIDLPPPDGLKEELEELRGRRA